VQECNRQTTDRQTDRHTHTDHAAEKCVAICRIACDCRPTAGYNAS